MTDYREILRLQSLGFNHSQIAESVGASRQNVIAVLQRAAARSVDWLTNEFCLVHAKFTDGLSDRELARRLNQPNTTVAYRMPDFELIHREMSKPG
jgi:DNA-directed RNA polymerase specialized sigma24 family protein